jgi:triacylglycerol lipase
MIGGMWALRGLSPRRRMLVVACGLAVAVAATVGVVAAWPGRAAPPPPQDRPGPVLLVPGYGGGTGSLERLAARIRAAGRPATVVELPGDATGDLREQAGVLDEHVRRALRGGAASVDVIGHSAGGVVARLWVQEHDGVHKARRVVTLGSPHHGAAIAAAGTAAGTDACPTACQQLAPGSRLLGGLRTPVPTPPVWLAVLTLQDETVTPPESARLEGAVNVVVQETCPRLRVSHGGLPNSAFVTGVVLRAIEAGPVAPPDPAQCRGVSS